MNGPNLWTEHRNPEGRTYWFNTQSRESVWEKPDDLKTPFEKALNQTKWKEYFSGGRKYYYNVETKESKWDMPEELLTVLENVEKEKAATQAAAAASQARIVAPGFTPVGGATQGALVPMGGADPSLSTSQQQNGEAFPGQGATPGSSAIPGRPNLPEDPVIPHNGFATVEEGEKAFTHLLRKAGVDPTWTWDQTMRAIITDPLYKALNSLAEKKACFEKYVAYLKAKEKEEKEARLAKLRPALRNMLKGNPSVFHYTTFATADQTFAQHPIWQQARVESERRLIFEEYVEELKQREIQESRTSRSRSVQKVMALFKKLDIDVTIRWRDANRMVEETQEWEDDPELEKLPKLDVLLAFEDYSRVKEREFEEQMRRSQVDKTRKERKAREAFNGLLKSLVDEKKLKAGVKWKEVYPLFKEDERYLDMLGNPGSNPIELFWDAVDAMDQKLEVKVAAVDNAIAKVEAAMAAEKGEPEGDEKKEKSTPSLFEVGPDTKEEQYLSAVKGLDDDDVKALPEEDLKEIFSSKLQIALKKQADERRRAERKLRHMQDDLRYALKKLPEPLDVSMSYEDAVPIMQDLPEYKALEDDDGRRSAFSKFIKRQKEKMREAASEDGSTTSRKRKEPHRDDRDRDRDRDYKERDRDRYDSRSSRHHSYRDDYDSPRHKSSRDYDRDYKSSRKDRRDRDRRSSRGDYAHSSRDYEESKSYDRDRKDYDEDRGGKRTRYEGKNGDMDVDEKADAPARDETPEEGEI